LLADKLFAQAPTNCATAAAPGQLLTNVDRFDVCPATSFCRKQAAAVGVANAKTLYLQTCVATCEVIVGTPTVADVKCNRPTTVILIPRYCAIAAGKLLTYADRFDVCPATSFCRKQATASS
jgi:hypothetical protein